MAIHGTDVTGERIRLLGRDNHSSRSSYDYTFADTLALYAQTINTRIL